MKRFVITALACSFLAASLSAQPAAQLLERGIYAQETAGDLDTAIQIYRQIAGSTQDRAIAAQAQYRLTDSLLAKGDLAAASEEFGKLARNFPDSPLVKTMTVHIRAIAENGIPQLLGSLQSGRYHHNLTGTELSVPSDWSFRGQKAQPDGGDRIDFADATGRATAFLWIRQAETPEAQIADRLRQRLDSKLKGSRTETKGGLDSDTFHGFALRPDSPRPALVGGHQALYAVGDYTNQNGDRITEYQVFIETGKTAAFFSGRAKSGDFPAVQARFDQLVNSVTIR